MTAIIIIGIVIFIIYASSSKKKPNQQSTTYTNSNKRQKSEKEIKEELVQNLLKNIKVTVTTSEALNNYTDDSIIDVTDKSYKINSINNLEKYSNGVPYWAHHYVYSYSEINTASPEQKLFYETFKSNFLKNICLDIEGNANYAFLLLFNLIDDYENHRNISLTEQHLFRLSENYPKTKFYAYASLIKKLRQLEEYDIINVLSKKQGSFYSYQPYQSANSYDNYWGLGAKYQKELNLLTDEVELLNLISSYSNTFFDIKYCGTEIIKLFLALRKELDLKCKNEGSDLDKTVSVVADIIVTKQLKYRRNTESYKYTIETYKRVIYTAVLKNCENAVREKYSHKRKLNADLEHINQEYIGEYETKITSNLSLLLPRLISSIALPDEATEIELYSQSTNRWKTKFDELTTSYNEKPKEFIDSIISLGNLNKKNPSIENVFFEASKFIAKYDKQSALTLYVHYLYYDLKSATFDNKQLTKTIQKSLFKTNEQLHDFEIIVSELIKDKDLDKAVKSVSKVYEVKRKKIQLDTASIKEVQQQHSGTVELLNEYLKDDFEDESNTIKSQEISNEEIKIEITQKSEEVHQSAFVSELAFSEIHITALELFAKSNFWVPQSELEVFAKSKGIFKNQLVESINDTCYEFLDDILIEEEDDYYTINTNYFQSISAK